VPIEHKEEEKEKEEKGKETPNKVKKTNGLSPNTKEKEKEERQKETITGMAQQDKPVVPIKK